MLLWLIVLFPFVGGVCTAFLRPNARNAEAWLAGIVALATLCAVALLYPQVANGVIVRSSLEWLPQAGVRIALRMDGFAWMFAGLVTSIGALVVLYARYYMSPADPVPRFFSFLLAFMGSMLGIVLSGNLIQLVVFWEMTSLTSFVLIGYWYHRAESRRGAIVALSVTGTGGLCLLAGVLLLGHIVGSYELDAVLAAADRIHAHPWYPAALVLLLLGAFTKSAQVPFQFWLPQAMAAPTPVSAYLHSAAMVKAGVFLLARLWPALAGTDLWFGIVCSVGMGSLVLGACAALFQRDIKGVLAYSTVSHLGLMTLLLGMDSPLALVAAIFHMLNHATFKASLFMAAGIVDHETGTRDLARLGGLARAMPITATLALVAAAAMAGVPLLNGFLSKEMFFAETIFAGETPALRIGLPALATLAGVFSVAYSTRFFHRVFLGPPARDLPREPHEPTHWMLAPSLILVVICLLVGIMPAQTIGPVLSLATHAILGSRQPAYSLSAWPGFHAPLAMSAIALVGGFTLYAFLLSRRVLARLALRAVGAARRHWFDRLTLRLVRTFDRLQRLVISRRLQIQLLIIVIACSVVGYLTLNNSIARFSAPSITVLELSFALLWIVGGACALGTALQAKFHRLAALIMFGGAGLVTFLTFAWFSAPDLALTQISVEVVTMVLMLLGLRWLPKRIDTMDPGRRTTRARARRLRDAIVATLAGAGMALLSYTLLVHPGAPSPLSEFFLAQALPASGGRNVVNVTLVDFRGFDTLGEITVVAIVALTVYKVLRRFRPPPESLPGTARDAAQTMISPATLRRLVLPAAGVISLYVLLRGHNAPGGGFVGGLILATAFIVQYLVTGTLWVESRLRIRPQYWMAVGLLAAASTGCGAWLGSRAFLTNMSAHIDLPLVGDVHLSSTLLFDVGVYLVVIGATTLILVSLAHQSLRGRRAPEAEPVAGIRVRA
ncbi:MAG TPA: monovalent cation/H+ antiporter subunit A [Steroidobacteraceae bacterium]|nr:monovalent cation/H+ antiporter subunit A [Steroidobacteraceae bacterium]